MTDDRRVLVIGSGPSGAIAALTLVERGIPVTMLESGRRAPRGLLVRGAGRNLIRKRPKIEDPKRHVATADPDAAWYHALALGGMSSHWAGAVPRFGPEDFTEGERLDERFRWPVSYADLAPYYRRIERILKVSAAWHDVPAQPGSEVAYEQTLPIDWQRVAAHAEALGHGLTPLPLAAGPRWTVRGTGVGFNSYTHVVQGLESSPHFRLLRGAHALRLNWDGSQGRVTSVTYVDQRTGAEHRVDAAAVVVSAGPLASTKLLLDSASTDFPDGLGNTDGVLGRYLHDHPHDIGAIELDRPLPGLSQAAVLTRAPYRDSSPLLGAACVIGCNSAWDKIRTVGSSKTATFGLWIFGTMIPSWENYVRLDDRAKDAHGLPKLAIHMRYDEETQLNVSAASRRLTSIFDAAGFRCTVRSTIPRLTPGLSIHYGGTVRMHHSPRVGMLNAWNRLHAVDNVVVADASCFTTGPEKNPTLTVMALAARAAERLAVDLKTGVVGAARLPYRSPSTAPVALPV